MAKKPAKPKVKMGRTFASDVTIKFGPLMVVGSLCSVRKSESSNKRTADGTRIQFESACPTCYADDETISVLKQTHICESDDDHRFGRGEGLKALDGKIIGTSEEVTSVGKEDTDEAPVMVLASHFIDEVEANTCFAGTVYAVNPKTSSELMSVLLEIIDRDGVVAGDRPMVLVGEVVLRGHKKLFQLRTWNGQLLLQELARPEDMYEMDRQPVEHNDQYTELTKQLIEATATEFDPETYADEARKRLVAFTEARLDAEDGEVPALEVIQGGKDAASSDALLAMLTASVSAAKAAKAS